jgi:hypothetical protein
LRARVDRLKHHADTEPAGNFGGFVGGVVVDDNQLAIERQARHGDAQREDGSGQQGLLVIGRDDNGVIDGHAIRVAETKKPEPKF